MSDEDGRDITEDVRERLEGDTTTDITDDSGPLLTLDQDEGEDE